MVRTKKPGPKPQPELARSYTLRVRLNAEEQQTLEAATARLGADLSTWVRELALKAAHRALAKEG